MLLRLAAGALLLTAVTADAQRPRETTFSARVQEEVARHPKSEIADLWSFAYHAALGPMHSGLDTAMARSWLAAEVQALRKPPGGLTPLRGEVLYEPLTPDGALVRVNVRPWLARGGTVEALAAAYARTARETAPSVPTLDRWWTELVVYARAGKLPFTPDSLAAFGARQRRAGYPMPPQSPAYLAAYRTSYRVARRTLADSALAAVRR